MLSSSTDSMLKPLRLPFSPSRKVMKQSKHPIVWVFRKCMHSLDLFRLLAISTMHNAIYITIMLFFDRQNVTYSCRKSVNFWKSSSFICFLFLAGKECFFTVKADAAICKFYGSGFRSHLCQATFSCTKQLVLLHDIANLCVLLYYFNVLS